MSVENTPLWIPGAGQAVEESKHLSPSGCHLCPSTPFTKAAVAQT